MTAAGELLIELRAAGITLAANGERLVIGVRKGQATPDLVDRVRAAKADLLALLSPKPPATALVEATGERCRSHVNPADWHDTTATERGWVKSVCRKCGVFIGYRPTSLN